MGKRQALNNGWTLRESKYFNQLLVNMSDMANPPSICFISIPAYGYFQPEEANPGGSRQFYLLAHTLADSFDVHFIVGDYGQAKTEYIDGVTLQRTYKPEKRSGPLDQSRKLATLFRTIQRVDADIYIYCGYPHKTAVTSLILDLLRKRQVYQIVADHNLGRDFNAAGLHWQYLFERSLSRVDRIVAQTEVQADRLRSKFDQKAVRIPIGYEPVDDFISYEERNGFVWIGNINQTNKAPHRYLDAAERLQSEEFTLVGPPDDDEEYVSTIRQRAASLSNVEYHGPVPSTEIHEYFRDRYALVNTSPAEGFPNTFLEAWRYGTPVVSLNVDPGRYVAFDRESGGADGDFDQFVSLLGSVATDIDFRSSLGEQAKATFLERYRLSIVSERYESLLREVLAEIR
uniref:Glycosyltransferase subfamily 4-like N-terminal domain-containing protein n=1 Tax=uncultured haloarchaeon TaxID=160804 RepID=A5YSN7_9EURY|nr:hypothetical protein [uncultured haloarchaeon]